MKRVILIFIVLLLSACEPANTYCPEETTIQADNKLGDLFQIFEDYVKLYEKTGWNIYPEDIKRLEEVRTTTVNYETPECLDKAKYYLIKLMDASINGLYLYQVGDVNGVYDQMVKSNELSTLANEELTRIRRCLPNCKKEQ